MSRYRPPTVPGSKYITPEGAKRLRDELDQLWREERPRVTIAVSEAAAQGDRSENAEYTYGKKRLHEIDRRVRFLRNRLEGMIIVDPAATERPGEAQPGAAPSNAEQPTKARPIAARPIAARPIAARRDPDRVYFGAWVQLEHTGRLRWYRLVGPDEFDMAPEYISMDSPLGRSLLGKHRDDEIRVALPAGSAMMIITAIHYGPTPPGRS